MFENERDEKSAQAVVENLVKEYVSSAVRTRTIKLLINPNSITSETILDSNKLIQAAENLE